MSGTNEIENFKFDLPPNQSNVIKVIGVGGGGSNAVNHMFQQGINGVDFVICNTDAQALENSPVPIKIQLGVSLTEGLGAGADPMMGERAAMESLEEIKNMLTTNTKMIFITAGMGGGTGTGAAPIIAKMAKELDVLTVGIVTIPFQFEGKRRNQQAQVGVENLRGNVDSLIVINNNKLREVYGNLGFKAGFSKADEVLATAARGIAEVITHHYTQNIDLRDARTVLADSGTAIMGSASASGPNRAADAINSALDSPLLNDNKIRGARNVLLLIVSGSEEITIDEIGEISDHIQEEAGHSANIIMGVGEDSNLEGAISITVIATGFNPDQQDEIVNTDPKKIVHTLDDEQKAEHELNPEPTASTFELPVIERKIEEVPAEPVIRHTLTDDEVDMSGVEEAGFNKESTDRDLHELIDTTELIRQIEVQYEEIDIHHIAEFEQVVINEIDVNDYVIVEKERQEPVTRISNPEPEEEQMLTFDFPSVSPEPKSRSEKVEEPEEEVITGSVDEIEVKDAIEVVPVTEVSTEGVKRYSLDDYQEMETALNEARPADEEYEDEEVHFKTRIVEKPEPDNEDEPADPLNTPISKLLRDRAEERKRKLKKFNYEFRNNASKIEEIEKQPAYKRMGIELDEESSSADTKISRTSVNSDDDDIELRSNNSFLHDNVD